MKTVRIMLYILVALVLVAAGLMWKAEADRIPFDDAARAKAPGAFVTLTDGQTHFITAGPETGLPVVLVHGLATPSLAWDGVMPHLAEAGYRVFAYDMYGRGFSDRPDTAHTVDLLDRQLSEFIAAIGLADTPVRLAGISMGGPVSGNFASRHPEQVAQLMLIAPAGYPVEAPLIVRMMTWPVIGKWLTVVLAQDVLTEQTAAIDTEAATIPDLTQRVSEGFGYRGYFPSLANSLRNYPIENAGAAYAMVGQQGTPVLAVFGSEDGTIPLGNLELLKRDIPQLEAIVLTGADHDSPNRWAEPLSDAMLAFMAQ